MSWNANYRSLQEGEIIKQGDEVLTDTKLGWRTAEHCIDQHAPDPAYSSHRIYRRSRFKSSPLAGEKRGAE